MHELFVASFWYFPCGQVVHAQVELVVEWYLPLGQLLSHVLHEVDSDELAYLPLGQLRQYSSM